MRPWGCVAGQASGGEGDTGRASRAVTQKIEQLHSISVAKVQQTLGGSRRGGGAPPGMRFCSLRANLAAAVVVSSSEPSELKTARCSSGGVEGDVGRCVRGHRTA